MPAETETPTGQLLDGRYRLEEPIKRGGMGEVWRATHLELDRCFAVKLLPMGAHADQKSRDHFFREARLSSSLSHPNIVSVTDFGIDEQRGYFLVMELLEGQSLRDRIDERPLPPRIACDVLDQISSALRYAHSRGVVHCDLKPENIFLVRVAGENRRVHVAKLLDFGLSFRIDLQNSGHGGTPPYVAPERLRGESPTPRADVYALGIMLYELITGVRPYQGSVLELIQAQLEGPLPPLPSQAGAPAGMDSRLDEVVMRALSRNPDERHQTVEAFQFELRTFMSMSGMRSPRTSPVVGHGGGAVTTQLPVQMMLSPIPVAMFEVDGTLRYANQRFLELTVLKPSAAVRAYADLSICTERPEVAGAFARVIEKRAPVIRELQRTDHERRYLWLALEERGGRVTGVHASVLVFPTAPPRTSPRAVNTAASGIYVAHDPQIADAMSETVIDKRLGVVLLTVFLDLLGFGIVIPILPLYAEHLHASDRAIGLLLAIYSVMQLFCAPLWGRLSDHIGRRPILLVSIAGSCLSQLGYALAPSFAWLVVARGVAGVCGANISAAQAYVADVTSERDRASGMGLLGAALGLGFVFGPALGGLLGRGQSALPFVVAAVLAAGNFALAVAFLVEPRVEGERTRARALSWAGLRVTLAAPRLWTAILLFFVVTFGFSNLEATFSLYLDRRFGYDRREVAWLFTYIGVFIIVVQGGVVRRVVPRLGEKRVVILGTAMQAAGFIGMWHARTLGVLLVVIALISIGNALTTPSLSALISRLAGGAQGSVLGVSQSAGALARIAGPLVGTSMLALGLGAPYLLGAAVLLGASLLAAAAVHQPICTTPIIPEPVEPG